MLSQLEQYLFFFWTMFERDAPVCWICGDTGWVWGDPNYGRCESCYDPGLEEENEESWKKRFTKVEKSRIVSAVVETLVKNASLSISPCCPNLEGLAEQSAQGRALLVLFPYSDSIQTTKHKTRRNNMKIDYGWRFNSAGYSPSCWNLDAKASPNSEAYKRM